jgi:hypothetical protein
VTFNDIIYALESLAYLVIIVVIAVTLRGIRCELRRSADRMDEPE